jgi:hypothetical protein
VAPVRIPAVVGWSRADLAQGAELAGAEVSNLAQGAESPGPVARNLAAPVAKWADRLELADQVAQAAAIPVGPGAWKPTERAVQGAKRLQPAVAGADQVAPAVAKPARREG